MEAIDLTKMRAGYDIIKNNLYDNPYDQFHELICQEIEKNNIHGVNALIRWIDIIGYFPNNELLFNHSLQHGSYEMFLMIYYICLLWVNEDDNGDYLKNVIVYNDMVDYELKRNVVEKMNKKFGKMFIGMDDVAEMALTENDDIDMLYEKQREQYEKLINKELYQYNIIMKDINTLFYETEGERYNELSP
jgi:hypothetical protein